MAQINIIDYNKIVYFDENTGNYKIFDGERWWLSDDKFGTSTVPSPSNVALVDSAIVDKSVVGEEERPAMQKIWEGTFTGEERQVDEVTFYAYSSDDVQNAELLKNVDEVTVTFDGVQYTLQVETYTEAGAGYASFGTSGPQFEDYPFAFGYYYENQEAYVGIMTQTAGPHTIKVEYTPSPEPPMQTIWEGTFTGEYIEQIQVSSYQTDDLQNCELLKNISEVVVTFDGVTYTLPVESMPGGSYGFMFGSTDPSFSDYPFMFVAASSKSFDSIEIVNISTQTVGPHTIKVEGTPVEPVIKVLIPETTFTKGSNDLYHFDGIQTFDDESIKITLNGTDYYASIDNEDTELGNIDYLAEDTDITIYLYSYETAVSIVPSGVTIEIHDENSGVEHEYTIKVVATDETVEPSSEVLYENTFTPESELDSETGDYRYWYDTTVVQNLWKIADKENVKVTLDGTSYICDVNKDEEFDMWDLGDSAFINYPFYLMLTVESDTETESSSYEMHIDIETGGEHTIKIETTDEEVPIVVPGGGEVDWSALQPGKDN